MDVVLWVLLIVVIVGAVWWFRFRAEPDDVEVHPPADRPADRNED